MKKIQIFDIIDTSEKKKLLKSIILIISTGILEMAGIAVIYPALMIIMGSEKKNKITLYMESLGVDGFGISIITIFVIAISAAVKMYSFYYITMFSQEQRHLIGTRILQKFMNDTYENVKKIRSIDIINKVTTEVDLIVGSVLQPTLYMIGSIILSIAIIGGLFWIDFFSTVVVALYVLCLYAIVSLATKKYIKFLGDKRSKANDTRVKILNTILKSIKIMNIYGNKKLYFEAFKKSSKKNTELISKSYLAGQLPRYLIEGMGLSTIIVASYYLNQNLSGNEFSDAASKIGLYAYAGYKLLPALQSIYQSNAQISFGNKSFEILKEYLYKSNNTKNEENGIIDSNIESIILNNVNYKYESNSEQILNNINIEIKPGRIYGIIGKTGAGKSTLLDIICGLIRPTSGDVSINGKKGSILHKIAYVPQDPMLMDSTLCVNITNEMSIENVDHEKYLHSIQNSELSSLHNIKNNLNNDEGDIGEGGSQLSGGQRQRIGIARAIYSGREMLILDESTSNVDTETERKLLNNIKSIEHFKIILIVSHSEKVIDHCDEVYKIENRELLRIK